MTASSMDGGSVDPAVLGQTVLFAGLPPADLAAVAASADVVHCGEGEPVFRRGDAGEACYLVQAGRVTITLPDDTGATTPLDILGPGSFFGEVALLDGSPRTADVVADVATTLVVLTRESFLRLVGEHPRVADRLVTVLRQRLQRHRLILGETVFPDVPARLTAAVGELATLEERSRPHVEVLPVFLRDARARWLRRTDGDAIRCPTGDAAHPGEVVVHQLRLVGLVSQVAHSTSWRHDGGRLVLTYLAIVADPDAGAATRPATATGLQEALVTRIDLARGSARAAPPRIAVEQVLEHALRHLRWLLGNDPAVREAAGPGWVRAVEAYEPEPFRSLDPVSG